LTASYFLVTSAGHYFDNLELLNNVENDRPEGLAGVATLTRGLHVLLLVVNVDFDPIHMRL
jgi:hypothetical protein